MKGRYILLLAGLCLASCVKSYDVAVIGGGASGVAAALQAARAGSSVVLVEDGPWLGGMLTSAGVSAVDGNYNIRGGIFKEFADSLAGRYGGYEALNTGWVSRILFEPHVGAEVFRNMVDAEPGITLAKSTDSYKAKIVIDCTELGDVAKEAGVNYTIGRDDGKDIIQDLTWVAILKDYGEGADMTIPCPDNYCIDNYVNSCENPLNTPVFEKGQVLWSPQMMITYGLLPGGKYMINWPIEGNDYYLNVVDSTASAREREYKAAKDRTLGFVYFIQTELGMKNLGLADDEFPTEDKLAMMPYNRESRRIDGLVRFPVEAASDPYGHEYPFYRAGIAVGDYAVDHHHFQHPEWRTLPKHIFAPILAYTTPLGVMIPKGHDDLIVAEKSISVSNIMNGTTRLQPVVMELGQAAGELASQAVSMGVAPKDVPVRSVQSALLESGCYIMPFRDVPVDDPCFTAYQRIGATGILRGSGEFIDWQNRMWLRVAEPLRWNELHLEEYYGIHYNPSDEVVTKAELMSLLSLSGESSSEPLTRGEAAVLIDSLLDPFHAVQVDHHGHLLK